MHSGFYPSLLGLCQLCLASADIATTSNRRNIMLVRRPRAGGGGCMARV